MPATLDSVAMLLVMMPPLLELATVATVALVLVCSPMFASGPSEARARCTKTLFFYLFWAKYSAISATESFLKDPAVLIPISMFSAVISLWENEKKKQRQTKKKKISVSTTRHKPIKSLLKRKNGQLDRIFNVVLLFESLLQKSTSVHSILAQRRRFPCPKRSTGIHLVELGPFNSVKSSNKQGDTKRSHTAKKTRQVEKEKKRANIEIFVIKLTVVECTLASQKQVHEPIERLGFFLKGRKK